jgi:hypothetical protein
MFSDIAIMRNFEFMYDRQNFSESTDGQQFFLKSQNDWKDKAKNHVRIEICSKLVFRKSVQNTLH